MEHQRVELLDQINRLRRDPLGNQHELHKLRIEYNGVVDEIRDDTLAPESDIFNIFPPEIWMQIVKHALPSRGYSSALLLLTMVSLKWQQNLVSAYMLWGCIELWGSQEDLLATVETFLQLSRDVLLDLYIYVPARHDATVISSILTSIGPRIRETTIRLETGAKFSEQEYLSIFRLLLTETASLSSIAHIHLEEGVELPFYDLATAQMIRNINLPSSLRAIHGWNFLGEDFLAAGEYLNQVEHIDCDAPINQISSLKVSLPKLRSLSIYETNDTDSRDRGASIHNVVCHWDNLTPITFMGTFREDLLPPLLLVAPLLSDLDLACQFSKLPLLPAVLQAATSLRKLTLMLHGFRRDDGNLALNTPFDSFPVTANISCLRDLTLRVSTTDISLTPKETLVLRDRMPRTLIKGLSTLYRRVEKMHVFIDDQYPESITAALDYASYLPMLRVLNWGNRPRELKWEGQDLREIKSLEHLVTNNAKLVEWLGLPNLLSLESTWGGYKSCERNKYNSVQRLLLNCVDTGLPDIAFPEDTFSSLRELSILLGKQAVPAHDPFKLDTFRFQFLGSISLSGHSYTQHETMLCFAFLYEPDVCPALKEMKFLEWPPDWDVLFLMLEKRNFMANSAISKICKIVLPFIPGVLCDPLSSLLGGRYADRPSNEDLFVGLAHELITDSKLPGCLRCLLCMRGGCVERVLCEGNMSFVERNRAIMKSMAWSPGHQYDDPTLSEWITQRKALLDRRVSRFGVWGDQYERKTKCDRSPNRMEITEYTWKWSQNSPS